MGKLLRVNMSDLTHKWEKTPSKYEFLAGRALTSAVVNEEVEAVCHPLREKNKIVISPGLLAGTTAPSSGRMSIGAKSPLTGGIKEANAGGLTGNRLGRLGVQGIIIEGAPPAGTDDWYSIVVGKDKCEIVKTNNYAGIGAYEVIGKAWKDYPVKPGIIGCGVAGQRLLSGAGVFGNNIDNSDPGRYAGRGGLGAVFGSKRVVTVISDPTGAERPEAKDKDRFENGRKALVKALNAHGITGGLKDDKGEPYGGLKNYGTNVLQTVMSEAGGLPTKNFRSGRFDGAAKISGEAVHDLVDKTKEKFGDAAEGKYAHSCHPGCIIACSNVVPYADTGKAHVSPLEYETAWALGSNLEIDSLYDIAEMNRLCNDLGLDTIEAGCTLGVIMESGLLEFGDGAGAIAALKEAYDTKSPMGRLVSAGALNAGKTLGVSRIPVTKGQGLPAYDPRPVKGIGVTYATTPQGADHTAGYTVAAEILGIKGEVTDPRDLKKADLSRTFQSITAYVDFTGYCLFITFATNDDDDGYKGMEDTVNGFIGKDLDVQKFGLSILKNEREFNKKAGFTKEDDRLPEFFYTEKLPPHDVVFDVSDDELDKVYKDV